MCNTEILKPKNDIFDIVNKTSIACSLAWLMHSWFSVFCFVDIRPTGVQIDIRTTQYSKQLFPYGFSKLCSQFPSVLSGVFYWISAILFMLYIRRFRSFASEQRRLTGGVIIVVVSGWMRSLQLQQLQMLHRQSDRSYRFRPLSSLRRQQLSFLFSLISLPYLLFLFVPYNFAVKTAFYLTFFTTVRLLFSL